MVYSFSKKKLVELLIIISLLWFSINTGSKYVNPDYFRNNNELNFVNIFRAIIPYLFIFYFFLFVQNKKNILKIIYTNFFLKFFFIYALLQLFGLIYLQENIHEHYYIICLLSLIIFYSYLQFEQNSIYLKIIYMFNILVIFIVFIFFISTTYKENILSHNILYHSSFFIESFFNEDNPRASGLSRMALITFIFVNSIYFSYRKFFIIKLFSIIINIFLISTILLLQSRGAILSLILIYFTINVIFKFENFFNRLKYFFFFIITPILIFIVYPNIKIKLIEIYGLQTNPKLKFFYNQKKINDKYIIQFRNFTNINNLDDNLINKANSFSNNRIAAWNTLLQIFFTNKLDENIKKQIEIQGYNPYKFQIKKKLNYLTGYGPQADRFILFDKTNWSSNGKMLGPFGNHASNGFVYSLICSGISGFILFITLNLIIFFKIINVIIYSIKNNINNYINLSSSILIIIFLQFRILLENSYSVFGTDMIIFFASYLLFENQKKSICSNHV